MSLIATLSRYSRTRSNTQWHLALKRRLTIESLERRAMFSIAPGSVVGSVPADPGDAVQAGSSVHKALAGLPTAEQQIIATEIGQLSASDGATGDQFGSSVAISGNTIVVGAVLADNGQGAAYVFTEPNAGWGDMTQVAELTASDGVSGDFFGDAVSISGNTIVVGADNASVGANGSQGAAYVFTEPAAGWANMTQTAKLVAPNGQADADFGAAVSISGNTIVVGADNPDHLNAQGAAYVFTRAGRRLGEHDPGRRTHRVRRHGDRFLRRLGLDQRQHRRGRRVGRQRRCEQLAGCGLRLHGTGRRLGEYDPDRQAHRIRRRGVRRFRQLGFDQRQHRGGRGVRMPRSARTASRARPTCLRSPPAAGRT